MKNSTVYVGVTEEGYILKQEKTGPFTLPHLCLRFGPMVFPHWKSAKRFAEEQGYLFLYHFNPLGVEKELLREADELKKAYRSKWLGLGRQSNYERLNEAGMEMQGMEHKLASIIRKLNVLRRKEPNETD